MRRPRVHYLRCMPGRLPRVDVVAAALLTVAGLAEAALGLTTDAAPWFVVATVPAVTLPVAVRRTRPVGALLVVLAVLLLQASPGSDIGGGFAEPVALLALVYATASRRDLRTATAMLAVTLAAMSGVVALGAGAHVGNFVFVATIVLAAWLGGRGVRLAEERRGLLAERQAVQERSRIARELHDVVSHNVSAIVVQAGAERRGLAPDEPAARTLADIEEHGRQTLTELRRLLGLLRVDRDEPDAPLAPQPGLADVPRLVEAMRSSGVRATLTTHGEPVPVSGGLELTIYRVVQECLTNVRKHAGSRSADVVLRWTGPEVEVEVVDAGGRSEGVVPGTGYGLRAMTERVAAYGGRVLAAGPTAEGFRVWVTMPVTAP